MTFKATVLVGGSVAAQEALTRLTPPRILACHHLPRTRERRRYQVTPTCSPIGLNLKQQHTLQPLR